MCDPAFCITRPVGRMCIQTAGGKNITVTPTPCVLAPDSANQVQMNLQFHVPENTFRNVVDWLLHRSWWLRIR